MNTADCTARYPPAVSIMTRNALTNAQPFRFHHHTHESLQGLVGRLDDLQAMNQIDMAYATLQAAQCSGTQRNAVAPQRHLPPKDPKPRSPSSTQTPDLYH